MVKFVASDLDGTLLLNGAQSVDESTIQYINKLVDKGVIFAPASGRQITSLKRLFGAVSDKLAYIAENGALVEYKGETIGKTAMDRKLDEDILKIAVCDMTGIKNSKEHFINKWSDKASVLVSGELYLDLMDTNVNKGRGIEQVQQYFGLKPEQCMAFGDNYNDIAMLDKVYYSYVMEKAVEDVKKHGRFVTGWVEGTLREQFKEIR